MSILSGDIKLLASQRLTDTPDGGGRVTGHEIVSGEHNSLFPDISDLDRAYGVVNLRKAFLTVQTDNTDQPFDINEGSKLELGSTAKLRVLASYLETVAQIHRDYGGMSVAELRKVEVEPLDFILRWGIDYLVASRDRDLSAMLQAAMERRYSASPYESFFTGGGVICTLILLLTAMAP